MKINDENGLTLVELLASITIFSIVTISLFSFFPQAYKYTTKNQSRTLEINVARGVLHYVEQQDYDLMFNLLKNEQNEARRIITFNSRTICGTKVQFTEQTTLETTEKIMDLFPDQSSCTSMFNPTLNNRTFSNNNIQLYILPFNWTQEDENIILTELAKTFPSKNFETTKTKLNSLREKHVNGSNSNSEYPILTTIVYVDFSPSDKIPGALLKGSIASEITN